MHQAMLLQVAKRVCQDGEGKLEALSPTFRTMVYGLLCTERWQMSFIARCGGRIVTATCTQKRRRNDVKPEAARFASFLANIRFNFAC